MTEHEPKDPEDVLVNTVIQRALTTLQVGVWGRTDREIVLEILRVTGYWQMIADARTALAAARVAADTLSDTLGGSGLPRLESRQASMLGELGTGAVRRAEEARRETAGMFVALREAQEERRKLQTEAEKLRGDVHALNDEVDGVSRILRGGRDQTYSHPGRSLRENVSSLVSEVAQLRRAQSTPRIDED